MALESFKKHIESLKKDEVKALAEKIGNRIKAYEASNNVVFLERIPHLKSRMDVCNDALGTKATQTNTPAKKSK